MKIYELANKLEIPSKDIISFLKKKGYEIKSHLNILTEEQVKLIENSFPALSVDTKKTELAQNQKINDENFSIDDNDVIIVKSNVFGALNYENSRTGDKFFWNNKGEVQLLTFKQLKDMKSNNLSMFENAWIILLGCENKSQILPESIYKALYLSNYYKDYIDISNIDEVYKWDEATAKSKISKISENAKLSIIVGLNEGIMSGKYDSMKRIKMFEEILGCELCRV